MFCTMNILLNKYLHKCSFYKLNAMTIFLVCGMSTLLVVHLFKNVHSILLSLNRYQLFCVCLFYSQYQKINDNDQLLKFHKNVY